MSNPWISCSPDPWAITVGFKSITTNTPDQSSVGIKSRNKSIISSIVCSKFRPDSALNLVSPEIDDGITVIWLHGNAVSPIAEAVKFSYYRLKKNIAFIIVSTAREIYTPNSKQIFKTDICLHSTRIWIIAIMPCVCLSTTVASKLLADN